MTSNEAGAGARYDVVIVGGSFAGLAAAIQLGRARRRVLLVDAGAPRNRFAPESHGFLGQDGRAPREILNAFRAEVLAYPTVRFHQGEATGARADGRGGFTVTLASNAEATAERLVLATGIADELPPVPGVQERWGVSVLHCPYCHGYEVGDRRLGVMATGEASMHQALMLRDWSAVVTMFTNGAFTPSGDQRTALAVRGIGLEETPIAELAGPAPALTGLRLQDGRTVALDALFTAARTRMASPLAERLGCAFDEGPFGPIVRTDAARETTVPGVYCAGDAARAPHNATWAAADGVTAAISAHRSLVYAAIGGP